MYRFLLRPRWLAFHVVVIAAVVLMVNLGVWQLRRLDERQSFNDRLVERSEQPPRPVTEILDAIDAGSLTVDDAEWLPVTAAGTYLRDQVVEFNQSQGGRAGENVLTALVLDDDSTIIVNRGFKDLAADLPAAPTGRVEIVAFVRPSQVRDRGGLTDDLEGPVTEIRRIDLDVLAGQYPGELAPVYLQLTASDPAPGPGDPRPVVLPELSNGPHLSYAVQWFVFSLCVVIGWVLAVRRSLRQRRDDAADLSPSDGSPSDGSRADDAEQPARVDAGEPAAH